MKTLTLAEFDSYIKEKKPTLFIYDDRNNRNKKGRYNLSSEPLFLSLTFEHIKIGYHPCIKEIYLSGRGGKMQISFIKKIKVKEKDTLLGDTVIIYTKTDTGTNTYTIIIR